MIDPDWKINTCMRSRTGHPSVEKALNYLPFIYPSVNGNEMNSLFLVFLLQGILFIFFLLFSKHMITEKPF